MRKIVVLGATGSIGTQTLDIVRRLPEQLQVIGLSAFRNETLLREQAREFNVPLSNLSLGSNDALTRLAALPDADIIVVAVAGAVGTQATLAALTAGKDVALATKEVLVSAGALVMQTARANGRRILPIDSEHSALFQCLQGSNGNTIDKLWITASGGPFRAKEWTADRLAGATVAEALHHPTWPTMGKMVSIYSATLMNKALEMIEACWLFDVGIDKVNVVIHPQSTVHSLVEFHDGSVLAQLGLPDMRLPIEYALLYPERLDAGLPRMKIDALSTLTFEKPDEARFPAIGLARRAMQAGGTMPAVMNGANEAAVQLFLDEKIGFMNMTDLVASAMDAHTVIDQPQLPEILEADDWARRTVLSLSDYCSKR